MAEEKSTILLALIASRQKILGVGGTREDYATSLTRLWGSKWRMFEGVK
jgi:hypothetical protein